MTSDRKLVTPEVVYDKSLAKGVLKRELREGNSRRDAVLDKFVNSPSPPGSLSKFISNTIGVIKNSLGDSLIFEKIETSFTKKPKRVSLGFLEDLKSERTVLFKVCVLNRNTIKNAVRDEGTGTSSLMNIHLIGAATYHFLEREVLREQATTLLALADRTRPIFYAFLHLDLVSLKLPTNFIAVFFDGYAVVRDTEGIPTAITWIPFKEQKKLSALCKSLGQDRAILIDEHTFNNTEYLDPQLINQFKISSEAITVPIDLILDV